MDDDQADNYDVRRGIADLLGALDSSTINDQHEGLEVRGQEHRGHEVGRESSDVVAAERVPVMTS